MAIPKGKKKKAPRARARTGLAAIPVSENFNLVKSYVHEELDNKDVAGIIRNYIRKAYPSDKSLLQAPEYMYYMHRHLAAAIVWKDRGMEFPENFSFDRSLARWIEEVKSLVESKKENASSERSVSPAEIVARKAGEMVACIAEKIDNFIDNGFVSEFSVYSELQMNIAAPASARSVIEYVKPIHDEIHELVHQKSKDLVEGYSYMTVPQRKKFLSFLENIINEAEKYLVKKKIQRAPTKPRVRTADKQVAKMRYLKDSSEYKLSSINPMLVVGAQRLFVFNVRYRKITEYISNSGKGFEVKGTTLQNVDFENSRSRTLRKPDEILPVIQSKALRDIHKALDGLTGKDSQPNGRINEQTILLRVFDK